MNKTQNGMGSKLHINNKNGKELPLNIPWFKYKSKSLT